MIDRPADFRPHMGLAVKLEAALIALGMAGFTVEWDHNPPLALRPWDPVKGDTVPPANDPNFIVPMIKEAHSIKTNGSRATSAGSDKHAIAHAKRVSKAHEAHKARMAGKCGDARVKSGSIPSRGFQKRRKAGVA